MYCKWWQEHTCHIVIKTLQSMSIFRRSSPAANAPRGWDHHPESYSNCTPLHPTTLLGDDLSIAPDARLVAVPGDSADSKHARRHHPPHHPRFPPPVGCSCCFFLKTALPRFYVWLCLNLPIFFFVIFAF